MAHTIPPDNTGLSWFYRLAWRTQYILLTFMGPADQHGMRDPRYRLRAKRWDKVDRAREERGLPPLERPAEK